MGEGGGRVKRQTLAIVALAAALYAHAAPRSSAQQPPVFRSGTDLVQVDVIVENRDGRFVDGLNAEDFAVLEEGQPQKIQTFTVVRRSGPAAPDAAAPVRRTFVLLFDTEHLSPGAFKRVQSAAETFLTREFGPSDVGGVVVNGTMANGRLTSDREELLKAVRQARPGQAQRWRLLELREWPRFISEVEAVRVYVGDEQALRQVVARAGVDESSGMVDAEGPARQKAARIVAAMRTSAGRTLQALDTLARGLGRLEGRKTVIFLSEGFWIEESWARLQQITGAAARSGVTIYSIDARGTSRTAAGRDIGDGAFSDTDMHPLGVYDTWTDAPNSLAIDTGGFVVRNTNAFGKALTEIAEDTGTYYILGYVPARPAADTRFRSIEVKVHREDVTVRARKGYIPAPSPGG